MKIRMKIAAMTIAAAALTVGPVAAATAADAAPAQGTPAGSASLTVTAGSASSVTFDVGAGARPVQLQDGGVGVTDGSATSDALPSSIDVGQGRTVSGTWSIDDADTVTFHFAPSNVAKSGSLGIGVSTMSGDWGSDEWGHCVAGNGIGTAVGGAAIGAITGGGAIVTATGGLLTGIIQGAFTC